MSYVEYTFSIPTGEQRDWLTAVMSDSGFEGFEEKENCLTGYAPEGAVSEEAVRQLLSENNLGHVAFSSRGIEDKNWNEEWEKNFEPVVVAGRVGIRAPFHQPLRTEYELVIEPKMSFGTGHHATTALMATLMLGENFVNKSVLDFGCGTGVLAILAEKLNALSVTAIDHEEWAYNNCIENIERNSCVRVKAIRGDDTFEFPGRFDVILANINRNVILHCIGQWRRLLTENGILIVSRILVADERDVVDEACKNAMMVKQKMENSGWMAISFQAV